MKKDYSKLGGWLVFFIVSCVSTIFMAIRSYSGNAEALSVLATLGDDFSAISLLTKVSLFCLIVGAIVGIVTVVTRKKKLINGYFILIVLSIVFALIVSFMYPSYLDSVLSSYKAGLIIVCARDLIVLTIWFRYFTKASRVKVYFGEIEQSLMEETTDTSSTTNE